MSITVQIPTALRRLTSGTPSVICKAAKISANYSRSWIHNSLTSSLTYATRQERRDAS